MTTLDRNAKWCKRGGKGALIDTMKGLKTVQQRMEGQYKDA